MRRISFYRVLVALGLVLGLVLTACSSDDGATDDGTDGDGAATDSDGGGNGDGGGETDDGDGGDSDDSPVAGGTLRMVIGAEPRLMNPAIDTSRQAQQLSRAFVDTLVGKDADNMPDDSGLVTDWEQIDDTTWEFTIREGVTFHNGEPFDAEAAAFSVGANKETGVLTIYFAVIEGAEAIDETTFQVTTTVPTGQGLVPALMTELFAYPPEYFQEVGAEAFGLEPIGTGPYVFEEWIPGQAMRASANPDWWGDEGPYIENIEWSFAPEAATRVNLMRTDEADFTVTVPPQEVEGLDAEEGVDVVSLQGGFKWFLGFNLETPPLDDPRIREAISYAIDREGLTQGVLGGQGGVANPNMFHDFFPSGGANAGELRTHDLEAAQALVDEVASEGEIEPVILNYTVGRYLADSELGEAVAGQLEAAGLPVQRNAMEPGDYLAQLFGNQMAGAFMSPFDVRYPHEDVFMRTLFESDGLVRYCVDERLDELADQGRQATTTEERVAAYAEVERIVLLDKICWGASLFDQMENYGVATNVHGFEPRIDNLIDYETMWIS